MQGCEKELIKRRKSDSSRDLIDVWGMPNKVTKKHKEIEFLMGT